MNLNLTLFAQALAFAALIWLIATKIWPPLLKAIEERQAKIAEGLAAADRAKQELADADARVTEEIRKARIEASALIEKAQQQAAAIIEKARVDAIVEGTKQKAIASAEIESMATRAREELRGQVAALAVAGAEKILKREIDANAHKALIDQLVGEI
ncbi:F0F1 ATP synthase subunit B [Dokdonella sp. MW10]|uniref:F0F1 ATP synthase subunit B n=1 Tax=Dokdonella sp. MW10 TaxID=2992926 RepID=UPI003F7E21DB